jgi:hypothetical protein
MIGLWDSMKRRCAGTLRRWGGALLLAVAVAGAALALSACGGAPASAPAANAAVSVTAPSAAGSTAGPVVVLAENYENAVPIRNQLLIGTFRLQETALRVTPEQAAGLVPLWQALRALTSSGTAAQSEIDAVLAQIQQGMSAEQLAAIRDMHLVTQDMSTLMQSLGISPPNGGIGPGANLSEDERATRRAQMGAGNQAAAGKLLLDKLIELLANSSSSAHRATKVAVG